MKFELLANTENHPVAPRASSDEIQWMKTYFMFATGIENSSPTIEGGFRVDEMKKCGHYQHWRVDFECVSQLGVCFLRYGVPLYRVFLGPAKYDWSFSDKVFGDL